jgi:hypothetical protein
MKAVILIVFALMALVVFAWMLCELKSKKWRQDYMYLRSLARRQRMNIAFISDYG